MKNLWALGVFLAAGAPARAGVPEDALVTVDGTPISRRTAVDLSFRRCGAEVINDLIDDILESRAIQANGITSDPEEVAARMKGSYDQFQGEAGLRAHLSESGSSLEELRAQIESEVLRERLLAKVKHVSVTDAEVRKFYDANQKVRTKAVASAAHLLTILVGSEDAARAYVASLRAGADMARLASTISLDHESAVHGGDLGFVTAEQIGPEPAKVAFALKPGEISAPVKTPTGYHIFKLVELRPGVASSMEADFANVKKELISEKTGDAWKIYSKELRSEAKIELPAPTAPAPR